MLEQTVAARRTAAWSTSARFRAARFPTGDTLEAACYRTVLGLAAEHAAEIDRRYPKILRRVGGYNLDEFTDPAKPVNLAKIMVGSEGTLGIVLEAKLRLVPLPKAKAVMVIMFADLLESLAAAPVILRHKPSAVEVMDKRILDYTRQNADARPHPQHVHRRRSRQRRCASSSTPTATRICRRAWRRSKRICARAISATPTAPRPTRRRRPTSGACARPRWAFRWR